MTDGVGVDVGVGGTAAGPRPARWPVVAVVALYLASFWLWALATPVMGVPDEPAHAIKAASIWEGQLRGVEVEQPSGDPTVPIPIALDRVRVPASYAGLGAVPGCYAFRVTESADCAPDPGHATGLRDAVTAAGPYSPVFYVLVGWPTRFVGADVGILLMRLTGAFLCALLLGIAFTSLRRLVRSDLAFLAIALAATPMTHFLSGSVNPNGVEVCAAIAFWCAALAVAVAFGRGDRPGRALAVQYVVAGAALAVSRPLSPLFLVLALASSLALLGFSGIRALLVRKDWWLLNVVLGVPVLAAIAWTVAAGQGNNFFGSRPPAGRNLLAVLGGNVDDYLQQALAVFGWKDTGPVLQATLPWLAVVAVLAGLALLFGPRWQAGVLLLVTAGALLLPVVLQWPSARTSGIAWQGRYQLPVLVGVPLVAGALAVGALGRDGPRRRLVWAGTAVVGVALVACHLVVMQRNVVGVDGPLNYLTGPGWLAPTERVLLLVAALVVGVGFVGVGAVALAGESRGAPDGDLTLVAPGATRTAAPRGADESGGDDEDPGDRLEGPAGHGAAGHAGHVPAP